MYEILLTPSLGVTTGDCVLLGIWRLIKKKMALLNPVKKFYVYNIAQY